MYTSCLSALRVPLTRVAMSPLFIFRDFGPISHGIPHLSWRTVPHTLIFHWNISSNRAGEVKQLSMKILWPSPSTLRTTCSTVPFVAVIWAGACCCCLPKYTLISVAQRVAKFVNFDAKSFMFLWNILPKDYSSFVQDDHFVHSKRFCRIVQFTKFVVQCVKNLAYFPQSVIVWVIWFGGSSLFSKWRNRRMWKKRSRAITFE